MGTFGRDFLLPTTDLRTSLLPTADATTGESSPEQNKEWELGVAIAERVICTTSPEVITITYTGRHSETCSQSTAILEAYDHTNDMYSDRLRGGSLVR